MARPLGRKDKIKRKFKSSFARQYLEDYNISIYCGDEQILEPIGEMLYNIKLPNTKYIVGEKFIEQGDIRKITKYEELKDMGFVITSSNITGRTRWDTGQKIQYFIKKIAETGEDINNVPRDHYMEYDTYNCGVRLIGPRAGPLGFGPWISTKDKVERNVGGRPKQLKSIREHPEEMIKKQILKWRGIEDEPEPINVPEAAFMITNSNEIICFPDTPDMPSILVTGIKGCQIGSDVVLMSDGKFKKIENIEIGDELISPQKDGTTKFSKVIHTVKWKCNEVYDIKELNKEKKVLYTCSYNHLIPLNKHIIPRINGKKRLDLTHQEIKHDTAKTFASYCKGTKQQHTTILCPAISKFKDRIDPEMDPYLLGYFLGDGCFTSALTITISNKDKNVIQYIEKFKDLKTRKKDTYVIIPFSMKSKVANQLTKLNLRYKKSGTKFIPEPALYASIEYRKELLAGLIDSDGYCNKNDCYSITFKSKKLIEGFANLIKTIGGRHGPIKKKIKTCTNGKNEPVKGIYYSVYFYFGDLIVPIKNERKKKKSHSMYLSPNRVSIDAIKTKGNYVYGITLDSKSQWYVTNDYVVTHNSGKSFCVHSIVSRFFWKPEYNYNICVLNDSSRETGTWCYPNNNTDQINTLKRLNEKPLPLPMVYLHPKVKEDYEKLYLGNVGFDITIPFKEIVEKSKEYLNLGDSQRYFTKMKTELLNCVNQKQAEEVLESMTSQFKVPPNTANKIRAEFDTLFDTKMTDISTAGQKMWSLSKNEGKQYNSLTACVHSGVIPVLETEFISNYRSLLNIYITYFVGDLFNRQKQDPDFLKEQSELLMVIDEAHNISQKGIKSGADMLLRRCVREGRPRRIGTLISTQKFNELPDIIKDNSTYLICFKNPGESSQIASQYNLGKHMGSIIKDLGKHECLAYTTEHFIVYDSNGRRRQSKLNETFVGRTLPPYSMHKRPNSKGG